uniref:Uncharacterized protein n=1 Tax=Panagrolaimus superbus TaxID=310955 RepID=A0A914ZAS0_9BILA
MDYDYQAVFKEMKHKKLTEYITYDFELDEKKLRRDVARGDVKIEYKSPIFDAIKQMKVKWFMTVRPNCQGNKNLGVYFNVIDEDEDKESKRHLHT